jgi:uridine kinase
MDGHCLVVGVGGPSGSGKTALCHALSHRLGTHACTVIEMDRYYHDLSHLAPHERDLRDFDSPGAIDISLLIDHIDRLRRGESVCIPSYDFASHTRLKHGRRTDPLPVLIVEGIFALVYEALRRRLALSIFVSAPDGVCLSRRLARDVGVRGRSESQVKSQYVEFVRPAAEKFIRPSSLHANRVVVGTNALDSICDELMEDLRSVSDGLPVSSDVRASFAPYHT